MSKGSSHICVTVYYRLKHQPIVAMATEQHMAYNIAQNQKNLLHVLNMIEWSKYSFAFLIPLHFVEPACSERDIVVTTLVLCMCVRCACHMCTCVVRPSGIVWAITCTFMHGFQNKLAQLFALMS